MSTILRFSKIPLRTVRGYTTQLLFQQQRNVTAQTLSVSTERVKSNYNQPQRTNKATNKEDVHKERRQPVTINRPIELYIANIQQQVFNYEFIQPEEFQKLVAQFKKSGFIPQSQILFLLHCCGNYTIFLSVEERQKMTNELWSMIKKNSDLLDISLYNALLQIYYENQHLYSPLEMLTEMEKNNIAPNRVTFDKMIQYCCRKGDIQIATTLLNTMNENNLPLSKSIFNSLIIGHAQSGDVDYSVKLLDVMRKGGIEPDADTYGALMQAYAISGNMEKIREIITQCEQQAVHLSDSQFTKVIETLAFNGHRKHINEIAEMTQRTKKFAMEMTVTMCQLLENKQFDCALEIFRITPMHDMKSRKNIISIFVASLLEANSPILENFCNTAKDMYNFTNIYRMVLRRCFFRKKPGTALKILKKMHQEGDDLQDHYFWPLFCIYKENVDIKGLTRSFESMISDFGLQPSLKTITTHLISFLSGNVGEIISKLKAVGIEENRAINAFIFHKLETRNFKSSIYIAKNNPRVTLHPMLILPMSKVLEIYGDAQTYIEFVRYVKENHDNKYTLSDGIELFEEEAENVEFNDFVAMQAVKSVPEYKKEIASNVFNEMLAMGLGISKETAAAITEHYGKTVSPKMVETLEKLSGGNLELKPVEYSELAKMKNNTFDDLIRNENEESALSEMKTMQANGQEILPGMYRRLIHIMLKKEKIDEAKKLLDELIQLHSTSEAGPTLILNFVHSLMKKGNVEEAINFLTQNYQPENVPVGNDFNRISRMERLVAQEIASLNDANYERQYIDLFPHHQRMEKRMKKIFKPFIDVLIEKEDYVKALDKLISICETYNVLVNDRQLMQHLVKNEDAESLQRLTNYCATRKGEIQALYDLALAFMECGKLNQAKKLLSTPGLQLNINLISQSAQFYRSLNKLDCMNDLLEVTKDAENIDRSILFETILNEFNTANDWERALQLWVQMQEENLIPTRYFLTNLSQLLKRNNQNVPFKTLV